MILTTYCLTFTTCEIYATFAAERACMAKRIAMQRRERRRPSSGGHRAAWRQAKYAPGLGGGNSASTISRFRQCHLLPSSATASLGRKKWTDDVAYQPR